MIDYDKEKRDFIKQAAGLGRNVTEDYVHRTFIDDTTEHEWNTWFVKAVKTERARPFWHKWCRADMYNIIDIIAVACASLCSGLLGYLAGMNHIL